MIKIARSKKKDATPVAMIIEVGDKPFPPPATKNKSSNNSIFRTFLLRKGTIST